MGDFKKLKTGREFSYVLKDRIFPAIDSVNYELNEIMKKLKGDASNNKHVIFIDKILTNLKEIYIILSDLEKYLEVDNNEDASKEIKQIIPKINIINAKLERYNELVKGQIITDDIINKMNFVTESLNELNKKLK